jgi:preprotein translocase subunit YajC
MQNRPTENQLRINEIARIIDELSAELSQLLTIEDNIQGTDNQEIRREIRVGDRVEITNNYRDQLGQQGIVTRITEKQVTLRLDSTGRSIKKKKSNVTIVPSTIDSTEQ